MKPDGFHVGARSLSSTCRETLMFASRCSKSSCLLLAALMAIATLSANASPGEASETTAQDAPWFRPALSTKSDVICNVFLSLARTPHVRYHDLKEVPDFFSGGDRSNSSVQSVPDRPDLLAFAQRGSGPLYVERINNPGCGGACESESLGLYATVSSLGNTGEAPSTTPASEAWHIYETGAGRQYVAGMVDHQLEVYRASAAAQWELTCRIQLEPDLDHNEDPRVRRGR